MPSKTKTRIVIIPPAEIDEQIPIADTPDRLIRSGTWWYWEYADMDGQSIGPFDTPTDALHDYRGGG